jgi:hypothetical protein
VKLLISFGFVVLIESLILAPLIYFMRHRLSAAQARWHARSISARTPATPPTRGRRIDAPARKNRP